MATAKQEKRTEEPPIDVVIETESQPINSEFAVWTQLLEHPGHRRGLTRIELQRFHGRGGMQTFATVQCHADNGEPVDAAGDYADLNPAKLAHQLYDTALRDARRNACNAYRVQLWNYDKHGKIVRGEYAGLRLNPVTGQAIYSDDDGGQNPVEAWKTICEFQQKQLEVFLGNQQKMNLETQALLLNVVHLTDYLVDKRQSQMIREDAAIPMRATPKEMNERIRMGLNAFTQSIREMVRFAMWNKSGQMPPREEPYDVGNASANERDDNALLQGQLRDFIGKLTPDQTDAIANVLGRANFAAMMELLHGPVETFAAQMFIIGPLLGKAIADGKLDAILTTEQLAELKSFFS